MTLRKSVFFCCVMICSNIVALADREDRSEEVLEDQEIRTDNETSAEAGPPDSHEAMNNREINPRIREKRSYEFLMGLINNNSRYEVTKVDPAVITERPKVVTKSVAETELLLELMVRIAAHPDQWDRVHKLLQNIDRDLKTSRRVVQNLNKWPDPLDPRNMQQEEIFVHKKENADSEDSSSQPEKSREVSGKDYDKVYEKKIKWPTFGEETESSVQFENNNSMESRYDSSDENRNYVWQTPNKTAKSTYPKNFAYHRVTGKPIYLNKNPKAYIAVSVIAPKPMESRDEEVSLENELHQLKPWTHSQNLKNMANGIRRQKNVNRTKSVVPRL